MSADCTRPTYPCSSVHNLVSASDLADKGATMGEKLMEQCEARTAALFILHLID
jgi:hypothetical protein